MCGHPIAIYFAPNCGSDQGCPDKKARTRQNDLYHQYQTKLLLFLKKHDTNFNASRCFYNLDFLLCDSCDRKVQIYLYFYHPLLPH